MNLFKDKSILELVNYAETYKPPVVQYRVPKSRNTLICQEMFSEVSQLVQAKYQRIDLPKMPKLFSKQMWFYYQEIPDGNDCLKLAISQENGKAIFNIIDYESITLQLIGVNYCLVLDKYPSNNLFYANIHNLAKPRKQTVLGPPLLPEIIGFQRLVSKLRTSSLE